MKLKIEIFSGSTRMWQPDLAAAHADPDPEDSSLRNAPQEIPQQTHGRLTRQSRFRT